MEANQVKISKKAIEAAIKDLQIAASLLLETRKLLIAEYLYETKKEINGNG